MIVKACIAFISILLFGIVFIYGVSPYFVEFRARKIGGERPYCIMVAGHRAFEYETVSKRSQLSFARMQAGTSESGGSRGAFYTTDHALLIIDDPREYLNWSYRAENFVREPLLNHIQVKSMYGHQIDILPFRACLPKVHFVDDLS